MLRFLTPRHLRYRSIEEWMEREHITTLTHPEDPVLQDRLFRQLGELRKHLWDQHVVHLTPEERQQLEAGQHPSQSHSRTAQARPVFDEFRSRMVRLPYVADVHMVMYHMDRIVFRVELSQDVSWRTWQDDIPALYRGFEVGVWKKRTENEPNRSEHRPAG